MPHPIRFCLVLHNHQPVGNFDGVFEEAYQDSYLPFLDIFEEYEPLKFSLHTSGPLMEWLDERHPEYLDRLARLVSAGRIEIVGGAFYEAILTMIPPRDRVGQIRRYTQWLQDRLGGAVRGIWMPERVWEQTLVSSLADAGIEYTILDDFHFRNAGLSEDQLTGHYLSEDDGRVVSIFPGSERLRYLIPFQDPQETIDHLGQLREAHNGGVVVFGDDGEKFGTWPDTKKHVYEDGWLRRFFDALVAHRDWVQMTTLAETIDSTPPVGRIYLPDGSYREMTEWALPVEQQDVYDEVIHEMEHDPRWPRLKRFVRGGFWRNFKVKYPEANEMYARMMLVSRQLEELEREGNTSPLLDDALTCLYRAQCNCTYWHGAFGGIYLPHLRNAVYNQLIAAENLALQAQGRNGQWVVADAEDYNFDLRQEIRLTNSKLCCLIAPSAGGQLYELDVRSICHNLLATLARRPESYHRKVLAGPSAAGDHVASIHDRVVFKQADLDQRLHYDRHLKKSLIDHFYPAEATLDQVARGDAPELGDFVDRPYEAKIRRNPDRMQIQLTRQAVADGHSIRITKGVTLDSDGGVLEIAYLLEDLPRDRSLHFACELNFAGMPSGADDRYFYRENGERLGQLGTRLDLADARELGLVDQWLGLDVQLSINQSSRVWTFPIETVSQSEAGFELVHQSVAVFPHWHVRGDAQGRWSVVIEMAVDTSMAESRRPESAAVMS